MKNLIFASLLALVSLCSYAQEQHAVFLDMPDLTKSQATMLIDGIINYYQSKPDSTSAATFNRVAEIKAFVDNPNLLTMSFRNLPKKVVDFIEQKEFRGSILEWTPEKDYSSSTFQSDQMMIDSMQKRLNTAKKVLLDKIQFQCKYFQLIGMPCPIYPSPN
ncbi:hypothetical protein LV89_01973 [Arcicella aurantiaca]|uniref:Uncharacterized protein n=1 Tax=Arcicella aurantiaca TaxID=591202 RepID=A0A316EC41_9BACT|nr:hypothetical protein [Arcicella aurantiaca]PWK27158.1 hypothetical protein LV89_01973 [Arcicella aurantiaca]